MEKGDDVSKLRDLAGYAVNLILSNHMERCCTTTNIILRSFNLPNEFIIIMQVRNNYIFFSLSSNKTKIKKKIIIIIMIKIIKRLEIIIKENLT